MSYLKKELFIKGLRLDNRLVMPPMASAFSDGGRVGQGLLDYYDEKSRGGHIGLVIVEHAYVSPDGMANRTQLSAASDLDLPGLSRLAETIHKNGSAAFMQLNHCGAAARPGLPGFVPFTVSPETLPGRPLGPKDIERLADCFALSVLRAKKAGFDGAELHSAHGYLLDQFYSPLINRRDDAWGGSLEARLKLHLGILSRARELVGDDFILGVRLGACDYRPGGTSLEDSMTAALLLQERGADLIDVSGGLCGFRVPGHSEPGFFAELSAGIKSVVNIPVILTGGITKPQEAEELLRREKADLIGVGRAILRDSLWPAKAMGQAQRDTP